MLKNISLVVAYCLLLLLASFSSKSYEQQYGIGDTGPSGGTVISVTVESILSDNAVELVGDFEETTYTYTHTETIIEEIETVETVQITTEIISEETTDNLITGNPTIVGNVDNINNDIYIFSYTEGSIEYNENLSKTLSNSEINSGFDFEGGANVLTCMNDYGGYCQNPNGTPDSLTITVKFYDGVNAYEYSENFSTDNVYNWEDYSITGTLGSNELGYGGNDIHASLTFNGIDNGYWSGYYGNAVRDPFLYLTYDMVSYVINTVDRIVTEQIQSTIVSQTYEYESVYIPPVNNFTTEIDTVDVLADFTVEIDTFEEVITMDFEISETDSGEMQMEITTMEGDVEMEVEVVELEVESEQEKEESSNSESDSKEKKEDSKSTKEQIAQKIMERVASTGDQVALNNVKLAVMAQLTDTKAFEAYTTKYIIDNNVDQYLLQTIEDPYGILFSNAQDQLMNQMVESQYGRD